MWLLCIFCFSLKFDNQHQLQYQQNVCATLINDADDADDDDEASIFLFVKYSEKANDTIIYKWKASWSLFFFYIYSDQLNVINQKMKMKNFFRFSLITFQLASVCMLYEHKNTQRYDIGRMLENIDLSFFEIFWQFFFIIVFRDQPLGFLRWWKICFTIMIAAWIFSLGLFVFDDW